MPGLLAKARFSIGESPILFHPHFSPLPSRERKWSPYPPLPFGRTARIVIGPSPIKLPGAICLQLSC